MRSRQSALTCRRGTTGKHFDPFKLAQMLDRPTGKRIVLRTRTALRPLASPALIVDSPRRMGVANIAIKPFGGGYQGA